uniref:Secreted protein n=1 Tax=Oryza punctata TaxID=4537 RepID=A0A0E0KPH4_ORYPU
MVLLAAASFITLLCGASTVQWDTAILSMSVWQWRRTSQSQHTAKCMNEEGRVQGPRNMSDQVGIKGKRGWRSNWLEREKLGTSSGLVGSYKLPQLLVIVATLLYHLGKYKLLVICFET